MRSLSIVACCVVCHIAAVCVQVTYLTVAEFSMREELVLKIAILAEKFAPDVEVRHAQHMSAAHTQHCCTCFNVCCTWQCCKPCVAGNGSCHAMPANELAV
jgi:hypothetical protein